MSRTREQIAADRARYDAHQQAGLAFATKAPPEASPLPAAPLAAGSIIASETVAGGWYWSTLLRKGEALRIAQPSGPVSVALVCWNARDTSERLNLSDTVKVQWDTRIQKGRVLFSDMGRVLLSITAMRILIVTHSIPAPYLLFDFVGEWSPLLMVQFEA